MGEYKIKFVKNEPGIVAMLNSSEMQSALKECAAGIESTAAASATYKGATYSTDVQAGSKRAHARVKTASKGAYWNELRDHNGPLRSAY